VKYKKKLIEVALPLEAINKASIREKSIRHGHPSTLHLWWARRPLASARAVIFSQMVDDPSEHPDIFKTEKAQDKERQRLFRIIEDLIQWESTNDERVLQQARDEILQSWRYTCAENADHPEAIKLFNRNSLPDFHDPFSGGGALPLEAQRLGLNSYASDLNPVAVLINKAMIEVPPKFSGFPPVNVIAQNQKQKMDVKWVGASGIADDVRYYGQLIKDQAEKKIGYLYPKIMVTAKIVEDRPDLQKYLGRELTVISWLWARTVKSPDPAYQNVEVPLVSNFMISSSSGKEVYVDPVVTGNEYRFFIKTGKPEDFVEISKGTSAGKRSGFICLMSGTPITYDYIRKEGTAGRMGQRLMAIVAEGDRGRVYLEPTPEMERLNLEVSKCWSPETPLHGKCRVNVSNYGFNDYGDLFTPRQLLALTTFSELIKDVAGEVKAAAIASGMPDDDSSNLAGVGASAYANAISTYLSFVVDKCSDYWSSICSWNGVGQKMRNTFGRQAIPMVWDFAEANPMCSSSGNWMAMVDWTWKALETVPASGKGYATQADAQTQTISSGKVVSTDPPYYDNIGYADLSDFFYVWLRHNLKSIYPELFSTLAVPKAEELVATPYRHSSKQDAEEFFLDGMTQAMHRLAEEAHPAFPVTIYYAFKQAESNSVDGTTNTGWDTFLEAVIKAGFSISGTWPMRTEMGARMIGSGANALASSIVLVCRKRAADAKIATRRDFVSALKNELPGALLHLQAGNIAPVDLAQAAIGPGMAVYTRYSSVMDAEGNPISVRGALALINQTLDEALAEQEGDFDVESRWALTWFEQNGFSDGEYGVAEQLSKSKNTAIQTLVHAGFLASKGGKVRLLKPVELSENWDPTSAANITVWESVHHLIKVFEESGEAGAAQLVCKLGASAETSRELCYRLYTLCERKKRATEAMSYNGLVQSWPEISRLAGDKPATQKPAQDDFFSQE
jgi:putative DNA methylase